MDMIENGAEPPFSDLPGESVEEADLTWSHPSTLAVAALVLAVLSLLGAAVFHGASYTAAFADPMNLASYDTEGAKDWVVSGAFLTAAFALLPLGMAIAGLRKVVAADGRWTPHVLRAAALLAAVSLLLHVVLAVVVATSDGPFNGLATAITG